MQKSIYIICLLFLSQLGFGQNLESINSTPLSVSGNISLGSSFYKAIDRDNRRSPFAYFISANPNFKIYGIDIPVSFTYRDSQGSISNPFNRYTISPTYKWASLHIGNTGLNLHPYVLSGQIVNGVGISLKPGKFHFTALRGTLENPLAQIDTLIEGAQQLPQYKRTAEAFKLGFGTARNNFYLTGFRAKDDINSVIGASIENPVLINPEENIVLGTSFRISPFKWFSIYSNVGASVHTANQNSIDLIQDEEFKRIQEQAEDLITLNFSSKFQLAGDVGADLKFKYFGIGGEYKRVDPLYKSLGTYYFLEDYENILVKLNFRLLGSKIIFRGRGGLQRNNLNNLRSVTNTRQILNANLTIRPSRAVSVTGRYSNFQTDRTPGLQEVNDTLRLARTTDSYGITPQINFGSRDRRSSITASVNFQKLENLLNDENTGRNIENYNANLSYSLNMVPSKLRITIGALGNKNLIAERETRRLGGNLGINKVLFDKKLSISTNVAYLINYIDQVEDGQTITARLGLRYKIKKKISSAFNLNYLNRGGEGAFQEYRGTARITYILPTKN